MMLNPNQLICSLSEEHAIDTIKRCYESGIQKEADQEYHIKLAFAGNTPISLRVAGAAKTQFECLKPKEACFTLPHENYKDYRSNLDDLAEKLKEIDIIIKGVLIQNAAVTPGGISLDDCFEHFKV